VNLVAVNVEEHAHIRVRPPLPTVPHFVEIVVSEFALAATTCPLFFTKNAETGAFYAGALFGFKPGENLISAGGSPASFVPLDQQRSGFYISGDLIAIDLDNPRFSASGPEGDPLFDGAGEPGTALQRAQRHLSQLVEGKRATDQFIAALLAHSLIEPIDVSLKFDDGETLNLQGLYTVSLDALHELRDTDVLALFRQGHLQLVYAMAGSLKQVSVLADRRNQMLAGVTDR
jgi:hypothetical protein